MPIPTTIRAEQTLTSETGDPWQVFEGHERVVLALDPDTGMHAIVAVHSTALGPALGGTRMSRYPGSPIPMAAAYQDAMRLARAMTYKNSLAGLHHGGGKGVIFSDPAIKSNEMLHAYGRLVASLGGLYITAGDVGISVADMDTIAEECPWTTGRSPERGGLGDSGILTAVGVWQGMRAGASHIWGSPDLAGRTIGMLGAGKVGARVAHHLLEDDARVVMFDPDREAIERLRHSHPGLEFAASEDDLLSRDLDILSPNALGGLLTLELASRLQVRLVCGGANNQLASPLVADRLAARGITYTPDFMVNCGGVIQVAEEHAGGDMDSARAKVLSVFGTTTRVLDRARQDGVTPLAAAELEADDRIRIEGKKDGR
jgi:valine dehydrogenase (NAD+)